jgi:hypothetical protein
MNALLKLDEFKRFDQMNELGNYDLQDNDADDFLKLINKISKSGFDVFRACKKGQPLMDGDTPIPGNNTSEQYGNAWKMEPNKEQYTPAGNYANYEQFGIRLKLISDKLGHLNIPFIAILGSQKEELGDGNYKYESPEVYSQNCTSDYIESFEKMGCSIHQYHKVISECKTFKDYKPPGADLSWEGNVQTLRTIIRDKLNEMVGKSYRLISIVKVTDNKQKVVRYKRYESWEYEFLGVPDEVCLPNLARWTRKEFDIFIPALKDNQIKLVKKKKVNKAPVKTLLEVVGNANLCSSDDLTMIEDFLQGRYSN